MPSSEAVLFVERNINIEQLISEVENRPALWDMTQKDYSDRMKRRQCWDEITDIFGSSMTVDDKKQLGDILQKKWRNIRDRLSRYIHEQKGKSGDGVRKKAPYIYANQLQFLRDTITPKKTRSSLERTSAKPTAAQEEREDDDDEEEVPYVPSICSRAPNVSQATRMGKKKLHPVEEQLLRSLGNYEKRAKLDKAKEKIEDIDNRHFLLSLVQSLTSLSRHLNTSCRIEIMQCINKYETMSQQPQQSLMYSPTSHSLSGINTNNSSSSSSTASTSPPHDAEPVSNSTPRSSSSHHPTTSHYSSSLTHSHHKTSVEISGINTQPSLPTNNTAQLSTTPTSSAVVTNPSAATPEMCDCKTDPDVMFLLSLLPDIQKLNGQDRGKTKIAFQNILQDYLYPVWGNDID